MFDRKDLKSANDYSDISADKYEDRTDESLQANFIESQEKNRTHINGVYKQSLFYQFPHFITSKVYMERNLLLRFDFTLSIF